MYFSLRYDFKSSLLSISSPLPLFTYSYHDVSPNGLGRKHLTHLFTFFYRLSIRQLIDQLVEPPDLFHHQGLNCLHLRTADFSYNILSAPAFFSLFLR